MNLASISKVFENMYFSLPPPDFNIYAEAGVLNMAERGYAQPSPAYVAWRAGTIAGWLRWAGYISVKDSQFCTLWGG
jgi:hypothetical protein